MRVNYSARSGGIIGIFFSIFFNLKVCCAVSLELPYGGDSIEYTQHTIINTKKRKSPRIFPKIIILAAMGFFPRDSRTSSIYSL